jgi:hypothetical protein
VSVTSSLFRPNCASNRAPKPIAASVCSATASAAPAYTHVLLLLLLLC